MQHSILYRPDEVIRTGVIQPFNVVSQSPVKFARHEIDPFIRALRPEGSMIHSGGVTIDGAAAAPVVQIVGAAGGGFGSGLGIYTPEVIRTLSQAEPDYSMHRWYFAAGALVVGLVGGYFASKLF